MIRTLDEMVEQVMLLLKWLHRVAVEWAHDGNTTVSLSEDMKSLLEKV